MSGGAKQKKIIILGVELSESHFPALFQWAQKNPEGLKKSVEGMMKKQGFPSPASAMVILESDMSHGHSG